MKGQEGKDAQQPFFTSQQQPTDVETMLETHIINVLQQQATQVHFTASQRERVLRRITTRPKHTFLSAPVLVFAASLVIILSFAVYLFTSVSSQPPVTLATYYTVSSSLDTPASLANGGQLVSLDPTQHHIVYQTANEQGVMYTADVSNPAGSNKLAMRYARDVAWAPDGSALITTIYPNGVIEPLLALVHTGQYMDTLGHTALAASWSPTSAQEIVYATQEHSTTKLWTTTPVKGQASQLLATLPISSLVQRLIWSPNGKELAIITTAGQTPSLQQLSQPGRTIYIMDMSTRNIHALPLTSDAAVGTVVFSPDGHYLTYEQIHSPTPTSLHTLDTTTHKEVFTVTPQHTLLGWSWATDSHALIYSDGGTMAVHVLHGAQITFPRTNATNPLWLADGRILALSITNGVGKLEILTKSTTK